MDALHKGASLRFTLVCSLAQGIHSPSTPSRSSLFSFIIFSRLVVYALRRSLLAAFGTRTKTIISLQPCGRTSFTSPQPLHHSSLVSFCSIGSFVCPHFIQSIKPVMSESLYPWFDVRSLYTKTQSHSQGSLSVYYQGLCGLSL